MITLNNQNFAILVKVSFLNILAVEDIFCTFPLVYQQFMA